MNSAALAGHHCRICDLPALHEVERFRALKRVTSDSRPWTAGGRLTVCHACGAVQKLVEPNWREEIDRIYQSYVIYHQAGGREQPIFTDDSTAPQPRSVSLLRYLDAKLNLPKCADVLDFGCGTGSALRTYSSHFADWRLFGAELSAQNLPLLQRISGFADLFTCAPAEIPLRFELITLIHALEHVLDPVGTLHALVGRLKESGALFVQVPNVAKTPYDLVIADHLLHFTLESLNLAALRAGCVIRDLTDAVLPKELSLISHPGAVPQTMPRLGDPRQAIDRTDVQVDWLFAQIEAATAIAKNSHRFGLFGTSISGTWLAGVLEDRVSFFVDEDETRVGGQHMGRPILASEDIPTESDVFVPLIPDVASSVTRRLSRPGIRLHAPPPFGGMRANQEMVRLC